MIGTPASRRGTALLTVIILMSVILAMSLALLAYASNAQQRAIRTQKALPKSYCVNTGLQLAKAYFGRQSAKWQPVGGWLNMPAIYNPVSFIGDPTYTAKMTSAGGLSTPAVGINGGTTTSVNALRTAHPELFADLDGDGFPDVYIYIRDNPDEKPPAADNPLQDTDMSALVGAICISQTLTPLFQDGQVDTTLLNAEALLVSNQTGAVASQRGGGGGGNFNVN